jgi:hypothetical protein
MRGVVGDNTDQGHNQMTLKSLSFEYELNSNQPILQEYALPLDLICQLLLSP